MSRGAPRLRVLRLLALRPLRRRPLRALLAVVAVAAGASMAVSVFVVRSSVAHSVDGFGRELAGPTELRVVGATRRGGIEPRVVDAVAATGGVRTAVPIVQAVTTMVATTPGSAPAPGPAVDNEYRIERRMVLVFGVDCRAEALVGRFGCTAEMVADHGDRPLARGPGVDDGDLQTPGSSVDLARTPEFATLGGLAGGRFVVFPLPAAQRLFDRGGRLDAVYVQPDDGVDVDDLRARLEAVVGDQNAVLSAREGPPEVVLAVGSVLPLFTLMALFALGTGAMLVYNTVTLSLEERRRELAVVGALGGTPATVRRTVLGEAGLIGAVGGVLGAGGGLVVARPIVATLSGFTARTSGIPIDLHVGPGSLAVGGLLGLVMALAAAWVPVRRALRVDVAGELSGRGRRVEASTPRLVRRALAWAAVAVTGVALVELGQRGGGLDRWQVPAAGLGFALVSLGLLLFGASITPLVIRPLARVVGQAPAGRLAVANLVRSPGRTGVMVAALVAASTTAFVTAGYTRGLRSSFTEDITDNLDGVELSAVGEGVNVNLDMGVPPAIVDDLEDTEGVAAVHRGAALLTGARPSDLVAVVAYDDPWILDHDGQRMVRGRLDAAGFLRGEALINTAMARDTGLRPGDDVPLLTPTGVVDVPVQAVVPGGGGATGRSVQIPWELHRRLYGSQPVKQLVVEAAPGVSPTELAERLSGDEAIAAVAMVRTPDQLVDEVSRSVEGQMVAFWAFQRGLLAVSFVAVLSTLLLVGVQRRRELAMLAAVGGTPSILARMVLAEAGIVGLAAVALSAAGGTVVLWALLEVAPLVIGFGTPLRPDWLSAVTSGGLSLVVALLAAFWPARRAARTDVAVALRYE
jgi:putative ABC transport system permease protein